MKKALLTLFAAAGMVVVNAQSTIGKYSDEVYFLFNGKHPDTFKIDNDTLKIESTGSSALHTSYRIVNKLKDKTIFLKWSSSYYVIDGDAYGVIPGNIKLINSDNPAPEQMIPENTQINISAYPRGIFSAMNPVFNSFKADEEYRKNKTTLNRLLVFVFDIDGKRYEKRIVISNQSKAMVRDIKKQNKNAEK